MKLAIASTPTMDTLTIHFATQAEAKKLVVAADDFSENLNQFDYDLRLRKPNSTADEWKALVQHETLAWTPQEKQRVIKAFRTLRRNVQDLQLQLPYPDKVILIKTTMKEELDAGGYTRKNWIALADNVLQHANDGQLAMLIGHELFHVLSRHCHAFKQTAYATIGFEVLNHEIVFPADIMEKRISNPDIARRDSYISLTVDGKKQNCAEMIYTSRPFTEGGIMDYLCVGFVPLDAQFRPLVKEGATLLYPIEKVAAEFKEKVGANTSYNIDPEELSAEHFSFLLTRLQGLPNPEIIDDLKVRLQNFQYDLNQ